MAAANIVAARPNDGRLRPRDNLIRCVTASIMAREPSGRSPHDMLAKLWPADRVSPALLSLRTTVDAYTTADHTATASLAVADFVGGLGPDSAASALLSRALQLDFADASTGLPVPGMMPAALKWVGEGDPIPVVQAALSGPTCYPRKVAALCAFTREATRRSNFPVIVRQVLIESAQLSLDAALFSAAAATSTTPAGLRYGITPVSSGGGEPVDDLAKLAATIAPVAGGQIVFVAAPAAAAKLRILYPNGPYPIFPSGALPARTVMAVAANLFATAIDPEPDISVGIEATAHMDTTPAPIVAANGTTAAPVLSAYQTDMVLMRLILTMTWAMRATGGVAVVENAAWAD